MDIILFPLFILLPFSLPAFFRNRWKWTLPNLTLTLTTSLHWILFFFFLLRRSVWLLLHHHNNKSFYRSIHLKIILMIGRFTYFFFTSTFLFLFLWVRSLVFPVCFFVFHTPLALPPTAVWRNGPSLHVLWSSSCSVRSSQFLLFQQRRRRRLTHRLCQSRRNTRKGKNRRQFFKHQTMTLP